MMKIDGLDCMISREILGSVKTITYETLSNILRLINGLSAVLLSILPGKASILEGIQGWELRPKVGGPRLPRWMENGVSSFNHFVHELSVDGVDHSSEVEIDEYDDTYIYPATPLTPNVKFSRATSFAKREKKRQHWFISIVMFLLIPARIMFGIPFYFCKRIFNRGVRSHTTNYHRRVSSSNATKKALDHVVQRATDRRRGIIEDLHLGIEIVIETIFDVLHHVIRCILSPLDSLRMLLRWSSSSSSSSSSGAAKIHSKDSDAIVPTATLADSNPTPTEKKTNLSRTLNTDARTCRDVITELGYPYEAINVVTSDGYVLLLERMPRRDSKKAVYLQHGVFDSSMCWVSNGIVGSPAFAAFDHGYDVFLGNFRGLVSREHTNKNLSSRQYWCYSINEHGTQDLPALIEKINEVKTSELKSSSQGSTNQESNNNQPYKLCAICHSLGGAAILMYIITRRVENKPHRLSRSIMLSPAGFHHDSPFFFTVIEYTCLWVARHLAQIKRARRFVMFDYGSREANMRVYGSPEPMDLGERYNVIDIPIDLVAGMKDRVILPSMIRNHYRLMKDGGVSASYKEFEYAHLDFTFSHREELLEYVMSRLLLVDSKHRSLKLKKKDEILSLK
ncbi:hypothetical protein E3N88_25604 [Mikania micrantha]|uniref:Partial AB-hydrolase lipase domain-containing protein n=1 Tax=Mikania micrantha TaxID=192012 RepID=A0A5N6N6N0_9ASTR|nr:hypothetical protein E3N88_25604 [Mikania micrantha]